MAAKTEMTKETENKDENLIEYCVLCGEETGYKRSEPIWNRAYYVEGAGQLCRECFLTAFSSAW